MIAQPVITCDCTQYQFALRTLNWSARRPCAPPTHPREIRIFNFAPVAEHFCRVDICFSGDTWITLIGRVTRNAVTGRYALSAVDDKSNVIALDLVGNDTDPACY